MLSYSGEESWLIIAHAEDGENKRREINETKRKRNWHKLAFHAVIRSHRLTSEENKALGGWRKCGGSWRRL